MSFLMPKAPKPVVATPAQQASSVESPSTATTGAPPSLISTGSQGLKKKATTVKTSLLGGSE